MLAGRSVHSSVRSSFGNILQQVRDSVCCTVDVPVSESLCLNARLVSEEQNSGREFNLKMRSTFRKREASNSCEG